MSTGEDEIELKFLCEPADIVAVLAEANGTPPPTDPSTEVTGIPPKRQALSATSAVEETSMPAMRCPGGGHTGVRPTRATFTTCPPMVRNAPGPRRATMFHDDLRSNRSRRFR